MRRAQKAYDIQWLAERMPTDEYLARGAEHVANPAIAIFGIVGEPSACQLMVRRLGAPSAERDEHSETDIPHTFINEDSAAECRVAATLRRRLDGPIYQDVGR